MAKQAKKVRTFVHRQGNYIVLYQTNGATVEVVPSRFRVQTKNGRVLDGQAQLCHSSFAVPGFKELKDGELKEITGVSLK